MPLAILHQPFDNPDWLFEVKYDGFRALAYVEDAAVQLVSRKNNIYKSFGPLCLSMAACLQVRDAVLDGEIVYLGKDGRPQFYSLMRRRSPQHFIAFDLVWLNGRDLRQLPLIERKRLLREILSPQPAQVLYADFIEAKGVNLFRAVCDQDLEGIVAKRKDGLYTPKETTWVKIKNPTYTQMAGRRELFEKRPAVPSDRVNSASTIST